MNTPAFTTTALPTQSTLSIDGMSCGHCVKQVTKALSAVPGIEVKSVAIGSAQITVADSAAVTGALASLAEAGYTARAAQSASAPSPVNLPNAGGGCCGGSSASAPGGKTSCCG